MRILDYRNFKCAGLSVVAAVGIIFGEGHAFSQTPPALDRHLVAAIEQSHLALAAILNGNSKAYEALFADRDDITLGNPFGPFARRSRRHWPTRPPSITMVP